MESLGKRLIALIERIGEHLGFESALEVQASDSAWVDVVWFDERLAPSRLGFGRSNLRRSPVLPLVGFEIELSTANSSKHVKGSISNLNNLAAPVGVLVIGNASISTLQERTKSLRDKSDIAVERNLVDRVYRWIYAESQPATRVVIMTEREIIAWAARLGVAIPPAEHEDGTVENGS